MNRDLKQIILLTDTQTPRVNNIMGGFVRLASKYAQLCAFPRPHAITS